MKDKDFALSGNPEEVAIGQKALSEGLMGTVVLAGGMGSRLEFPHPKGMFPFSLVNHKSLFQMIAEKCLAASDKYGVKLPLAIMTSPDNEEETKKFFDLYKRFGLDSDQLFFFSQDELPLEDEAGSLLPQKGASGNGAIFKNFVSSGLLDIWKAKGIGYLNIIPVDNPLADPYDRNLIGHHLKTQADVTLKCTLRSTPEEKVGLLIKSPSGWRVCEYSEATDTIKKAVDKEGKLKYPLANLSLFCLSFPFVKKLGSVSFPYHKAKKLLSLAQKKSWGIKKETFIFDLLPFAENVSVLVYPRNQCFSPVKNKKGEDSPETARALVYNFEKHLFETLFKKEAPSYPFEAPADYYYMA